MGGVDSALDEAFFDQVDSFVSLCGLKFESVVPIFVEGIYSPEERYIYDFNQTLKHWDDDQAEVFLAQDDINGSGKRNKNEKSDKSIMQVLDQAALQAKEVVRPAYVSRANEIENFVRIANEGNMHLQQVRVFLLDTLLTSTPDSCGHLHFSILEDYWPKRMSAAVFRLVELCDASLYEMLKGTVFSTGPIESATVVHNCELAGAVFEVLADVYLSAEKQYRTITEDGRTSKTSTAMLRELEFRVSALKSRVMRWQGLCSDIFSRYSGPLDNIFELKLRHEWVSIFCGNIYDLGPQESLARYEELRKELDSSPRLVISFNNYACIPELSLSGCNTQISKYRAGSIFARIFNNDEQETGWSRIDLLEAILIQDEGGVSKQELPEKDAINQFLSTASLEFKLKLWYLLLDAYNENGDNEKSLNGFLRILVSSIDEITGEKYHAKSESQRMGLLLRSLNVCLDINQSVLKILREHEDLLDRMTLERRKSLTKKLIKVLRMLHMYVLMDDAINNNVIQAPSHPSWDKVAGQLKQLVLFSWSVFYFLFKSCLSEERKASPDILNDVLSIIHEELGTRGYCGISDSVFLDMCIDEIVRLDWEQSEADMLQCLHCKFGLSLVNEGGFMPYNHHSTPENLDKEAASRLVKFLLGMILRKKNFQATLNRYDVKTVLDEFSAALGKPDASLVAVNQNSALLDRFLDSTITARLLQDALKGQVNLSLVRVRDKTCETMRKFGFYYIMGVNQLNQFRMRKRSGGTTRMEDVEKIVGHFLDDLQLNSNRFESWLGLSQAYDIMAEEGMSYNAESFATTESRIKIGHSQRKAILSCAMAASIYLQNQSIAPKDLLSDSHYEQTASGLWIHFAKLLYGSIGPPMKREALDHIQTMYFTSADGVGTRASSSAIDSKIVLKTALLACALAGSTAKLDWFPQFLYAKIMKKLKKPAKEVLERVAKSINLAPSGHEVLDPHYKIVSLTFKYSKSGEITFGEALQYLKSSPYFHGIIGPHASVKDQFYAEAVDFLQRLRQADKRKWHHRPTFRLAQIYEEVYLDREKSRSLMSNFCSLGRTSTKPLVQIWKPEHERPGAHFEFAYRYVRYMIDLVSADKDTETLGIIARKLRRFSTGIVCHFEAWEHLCLCTAKVARELIGIPEQVHGVKYSDFIIKSLSFEDFDKYSTSLLNKIQSSGQDEKMPDLLTSLDFAIELRRLNNGFGSTSVVDDVLVSIYLRLLKDHMAKEQKHETELNKVKSEPSAPMAERSSTPGKSATSLDTSAVDSARANDSESTESLIPAENQPAKHVEESTEKPPEKTANKKIAEKQAGKGKASGSPAKSAASKSKVTRKEIIVRATGLLKAALPKLNRGDTKLILSPSDVEPFVMPPLPPPPPEKPSSATQSRSPNARPPKGATSVSASDPSKRYRFVVESKSTTPAARSSDAPPQVAIAPGSASPSLVPRNQMVTSSNGGNEARNASQTLVTPQDRSPSGGRQTASPAVTPHVMSPRPHSSMSQSRQLPSPQGQHHTASLAAQSIRHSPSPHPQSPSPLPLHVSPLHYHQHYRPPSHAMSTYAGQFNGQFSSAGAQSYYSGNFAPPAPVANYQMQFQAPYMNSSPSQIPGSPHSQVEVSTRSYQQGHAVQYSQFHNMQQLYGADVNIASPDPNNDENGSRQPSQHHEASPSSREP
jgi:hypothetical protein